MTAVIGWERRVGKLSELVIASDSLLSGGERWDACPKIFSAGSSAIAMAFAGDTSRALPIVLQTISTIHSYRAHDLRTLDVTDLSGHLGRVMNLVLGRAKGTAAKEPPDCEFMLGGWSWVYGRFFLYRYAFDKHVWAFRRIAVNHTPPSLGGRHATPRYATIGNGGRFVTSRLAFDRRGARRSLDYDPLEALYQGTLDSKAGSIGGPIQIVKIYQNMRVEQFAVRVGSSVSIAGREKLGYENIDLRLASRSNDGVWSVTPAGREESPNSPTAL